MCIRDRLTRLSSLTPQLLTLYCEPFHHDRARGAPQTVPEATADSFNARTSKERLKSPKEAPSRARRSTKDQAGPLVLPPAAVAPSRVGSAQSKSSSKGR